jgi:hypothetical protein
MLATNCASMRIAFKRHLTLKVGEQIVERIDVGEVRDVASEVALFLVTAGWARHDTRLAARRTHRWPRPLIDRRRQGERRMTHD